MNRSIFLILLLSLTLLSRPLWGQGGGAPEGGGCRREVAGAFKTLEVGGVELSLWAERGEGGEMGTRVLNSCQKLEGARRLDRMQFLKSLETREMALAECVWDEIIPDLLGRATLQIYLDEKTGLIKNIYVFRSWDPDWYGDLISEVSAGHQCLLNVLVNDRKFGEIGLDLNHPISCNSVLFEISFEEWDGLPTLSPY